MNAAFEQSWGNASSLHQWGNQAAIALERARLQVASLINAPTAESLVFTAGGSEANNLAILGTAERYSQPQHLIISSVEHSAIAEPARHLRAKGWQVTQLPVDETGAVSPEQLRKALQANTALVSVIYGQSEVGTLQPIAELVAITKAYAQSRAKAPRSNHLDTNTLVGPHSLKAPPLEKTQNDILFHTDAVQVAGRLPIDLQQLPVDMLSISSHKIYGPQGAGALYIKPGRPQPLPIIRGGPQEHGLRSGTQAIPNIVGFGVAAELALDEMPTETLRLICLRDRLFANLTDVEALSVTGDPRQRLPHHVSFCLPKGTLTGKALVRQMNLAGIGISAGSACHSGQLSPSPILKAMGYSDATAKSGIRLTLGKQTTEADIDWSALVLKQVLKRLLPMPLPA